MGCEGESVLLHIGREVWKGDTLRRISVCLLVSYILGSLCCVRGVLSVFCLVSCYVMYIVCGAREIDVLLRMMGEL